MSVPGAFETLARDVRSRSGGFTLLEMLVVVMIMGLLLGLVATISAPDERASLALEAERLARLLDLAATEARLAGKSIAWSGDDAGYRFWRQNDEGFWSEIIDSDLLRPRTLPAGMRLDGLRIESGKLQDTMRLEFGASAQMQAFDISLALGQEYFQVTGSPVGEMFAVQGKGQDLGYEFRN